MKYDNIIGDKMVFFTHTLNYIYMSKEPQTLYFREDRASNPLTFKISLSFAKMLKNIPIMHSSITFYE